MEKGCEAAAEIGMAIATPAAVKSELPLLQPPSGGRGIPFCNEHQERVARICARQMEEKGRVEGERAFIQLDLDEIKVVIEPPKSASIELVVEEEGGKRGERYLLWKGWGVIDAMGGGAIRRAYRRRAAVRTLLWLLMPKMMIMVYCFMLALFSMDISQKDTEDLQISKDDALMLFYTGFIYLGLRLALICRMDLRMQLLFHVYSAWVWGMVVFYFIVYPPFGLSPLAVLVMTVTGSGLYAHIVLLTLCDRLDGRGSDMFLAGAFVPIGLLLASQPLYLMDFGLKNYEITDYGDFMRNVLVGIIAAVAICYERLWHAHRFITSPMQEELSHKLDQIFGSEMMKRQRKNNIQKM